MKQIARAKVWLRKGFVFFLFVFALSGCSHDADFEISCRNDMQQLSNLVFVLWRRGQVIKNDQGLMADLIALGSVSHQGVFKPSRGRIRDGNVLDPLGHPYRIRYKNGIVTLWSVGKDGIDNQGEGDDIKYSEKVTD